MAFLDWLPSLSPVNRADPEGTCRARIFSADMCPLTYSFWVVEDEAPADRDDIQPPIASA